MKPVMKITRREALLGAAAWGVVGASGALEGLEAIEPDSPKKSSGAKPSRITLIQINDSHGYLESHLEWFPGPDGRPVFRPAGGYARIATLVKQIGEETQGRALFFDNGDTFHGTRPVVESQGEAIVPILNQLGMAAMTAHWDFAYGPARLKELGSKINHPILAINVYDKTTGKLFFEPYKVFTVSGVKIGVIGIACNVVGISMPPSFGEGLRFTLGRDELPGYIKEVRAGGVDLLVVLSHLGFPQDMKLLEEVKGVDVLLSGHTHDRLYKPVLQGGALVIQSGCQGSFLGRLDLEIENGKVTGHKHQLIEVAESIKPDETVEALVKKALEPYAAELARVVGEVDNSLDRDTCLEGTMDNFLLESVREHAGTQLGFSNGWRWGAPILAGKLTMNNLYDIIPMTVPISTVDLTGAELKVMLEENLEALFGPAFDQEGGYVKRCVGMTMYIRANNPNGHRVTRLLVGNEEAQPDKVYSAAFITVQGVPEKFGRNRKDLSATPQDAMLAYLKKHQPASSKIRGSVVAF